MNNGIKNKIIENYEQLYDNCIYSSVAHAISILKDPYFSYEQAWDGMNYNFQYGSTRGTVTFDLAGNTVTGAARDDSSTRRAWYPDHKAISLFDQAPEKNKALAKTETLEYLYDEEGGIEQPLATIAFWNEGNEIYTNDDAVSFEANGGEFILKIAVSHAELREYWKEEYGLKEEELSAIDHIYNCIKENKKINKREISVIDKKCAGYDECLISLSELGVRIS